MSLEYYVELLAILLSIAGFLILAYETLEARKIQDGLQNLRESKYALDQSTRIILNSQRQDIAQLREVVAYCVEKMKPDEVALSPEDQEKLNVSESSEDLRTKIDALVEMLREVSAKDQGTADEFKADEAKYSVLMENTWTSVKGMDKIFDRIVWRGLVLTLAGQILQLLVHLDVFKNDISQFF